jgi:hypothetical protein
MTKISLKAMALAVLAPLLGCVDPTDLPSQGNSSGYQRAIDQDVSATHNSDYHTVRNEGVMTRVNWQ